MPRLTPPVLARTLAALVIAATAVVLAPSATPAPNQPSKAYLEPAPSGLRVTSSTETTISIAWNPSKNRATTGYGIYLDNALVGSSQPATYTYAGLPCGRSFEVGVDSANALGLRSPRATTSAATKPCTDTSPPSVPQNQTTGTTQTTIAMSWSASTDNIGVAGYAVFLNGTQVATTTQTSYNYSGLTCGTTYTVGLEAYDAAGNRTNRAYASGPATTQACATADTTPPSTPTGLTAGGSTQTSISVSWNASTDNTGVTGYGRYRNGTLATSGTGTTYSFTGLACGTSYSLGVDAYDAAGNRGGRATITANTTACADTTPPTTPTNLVATAQTQTSISFSWNGSIDNVGVAGYGVYRNGTKVTETVGTSHTLAGLTCGTTYALAVDAFDAAGNRSTSASITTSTSACAAPDTQAPSVPQNQRITGTTTTAITMAWNGSTDNVGVTGYAVFLNGTQVATTTQTSYTYSGLTCGTTYTVGLEAYDAAGNRSDRGLASGPASTQACPGGGDTTAPSTPTGLATTGSTQTSIAVSWNASTDNTGVTGYGRYRDGSLVTSGTGTTYTFAGLSCGTSYSLAVDAYDAAGNRSSRATITATTSTCSTPPPPAPGTANLWVDPNGGSCTRQATPAAYADAQACNGIGAAYNAAASGDTIVVTAGTYGRQILPTGTKTVTIRNASGATPTFGTTTVNASNVTIIGIRVVRNDDPGGSIATLEAKGDNNVFDGVDVDTRNASTRQGIYANGDNNTFRNGSSFNVVDEKGVLVSGSFVTFDNFDFYDVIVTQSSVHNECVYSLGPNLTVRNSQFWNCATMALFITRGDWWGQALYGGVTLENNVFGHATNTGAGSWHYYSLGINGGVIQEMRNWRVVNNTFETEVSGGGTPAPGTIWANNVGNWSCYPQATFSNNVGKKCAASDVAVSPAASCGRPACGTPVTAAQGWIDPANNNFRLLAGAPAINAANPAYAPTRDKDGNARNGLPDAGAYERG